MLAGIGITIIIKEIPNAIGYSTLRIAEGEGETGWQWDDLGTHLQHIEPAAVVISVLGLLLMYLWTTKAFQKWKLFPTGFLVVVIGVAINAFLQAQNSAHALDEMHRVSLPVAGSMAGFLGHFQHPDFSGFLRPQVWTIGLTIAAVASIETLLCIEATDKLTR